MLVAWKCIYIYSSLFGTEKTHVVVIIYHDDVINWKHFLRYWNFVRIPLTKANDVEFDVSFDLRLNSQLSKSIRRWYETLSHSLWRHCNDYNDPKELHRLGYTTDDHWADSIWRHRLTSVGIPVIKNRRLWERFIFVMAQIARFMAPIWGLSGADRNVFSAKNKIVLFHNFFSLSVSSRKTYIRS